MNNIMRYQWINPRIDISLYVTENGIRFNRTSVQVTASDDNPMIFAKPHYESNPIYTLEEYRGLAYA